MFNRQDVLRRLLTNEQADYPNEQARAELQVLGFRTRIRHVQLNSKQRQTIVVIYEQAVGPFSGYMGVARQHPKDQFSRKLGVRIALIRALRMTAKSSADMPYGATLK